MSKRQRTKTTSMNRQAGRNLLNSAVSLARANRCHDAIQLFREAYNQFPDRMKEHHLYNYARALNNAGQYTQSVELCEQVQRMNPNHSDNNRLLAWNLFEQHIRHFQYHTPRESYFFKAAEQICRLCKQEKGSPFAKTVLIVCDYLATRPLPDYPLILDWIQRIRPTELSTEPKAKGLYAGTIRTYISDSEKFYGLKSMALYGLGRYQECVETIDEAFAEWCFRDLQTVDDLRNRQNRSLDMLKSCG